MKNVGGILFNEELLEKNYKSDQERLTKILRDHIDEMEQCGFEWLKHVDKYDAGPLVSMFFSAGFPLFDYINNVPEGCFSFTSSIIGVELPDNIKNIKRKAFQHCSNLSTVIIRDARIIDENAFSNCTKLENVILPSDVGFFG